MPKIAAIAERRTESVAEACQGAKTSLGVFEAVSERLQRAVPFDGGVWFATDPETILGTAPIRIENIESGHCETFWERECRVEDALLFRDLARSPVPAASLLQVTDDQPARSARYREFLAPQGYGDELRAAFRVGESTWGVVGLFREQGRPAFSERDVEVVRSLSATVATALRAFATTAYPGQALLENHGPGTALFDDGALLSLDDQAERWFTEVAGPDWPTRPQPMTAVYAVIARAAAVFAGRERGPASARVRAANGRWFVVHASCLRRVGGLPGPIALTIEPAKSAQIAPIIIEAYCLTAREQQITQAVARGLSNTEIAGELFLSAHTVRDHLKAIFGKVGVSSRGELVAKLFAEHYGPVIHAPHAEGVEHVEF